MELAEIRTIDIPRLLTRQSVQNICAQLQMPGPGIVVLRGSRESFCEGMDLAELHEPADVRAGLEAFGHCLEQLRVCPRPVIAVVEAPAIAGGVGLVAACDTALASESASLNLSELLFGMMPAIVFPFLLDRMSPQKARLWALAARTLSAQEAFEIGLVDEVAPAERIEHSLRSWVRRLSRVNPAAVDAWKRYTMGPQFRTLSSCADAGAARMLDPETRSAVRRFTEEGIAPWH
jgi:enoyl-CoA hydratase/carnithine racemase